MRPPPEIEAKAKLMMIPINSGAQTPEATQTISNFVTKVHFPNMENHNRGCTVTGYKRAWAAQLEPRCGNMELREFQTRHGQKILNDIAKDNPEFRVTTLKNLKSLLSGIFTEAIRLGYLEGQVAIAGGTKTVFGNPMRGVKIPPAPDCNETYAYSLDEVTRMLVYLPHPTDVIVATAAFTGLRRSEIAGLLIEDYNGEQLTVTRSITDGDVNKPKSRESRGAVPVIPYLRQMLDAYLVERGKPKQGVLFPSGANTPLNLNNVLNRSILPALNRCAVCGEAKGECDQRTRHQYKRDVTRPAWHGWHAFRRGLATNLHDLGVDDLTIQRILRHSDVSVTQKCYIKSLPPQSIAAMNRLEKQLAASKGLLCADCALEAAPVPPGMLN